MGSDIEVEELIYVGCEIVLWDMVDGGPVSYVGLFGVFVKEVVDVVWKWGLVLIVVEGGFCIWNCDVCNVGVIVLDMFWEEKVFNELGVLLFVWECCVWLRFVLVRLYDSGLFNRGCNGGRERCLEVV